MRLHGWSRSLSRERSIPHRFPALPVALVVVVSGSSRPAYGRNSSSAQKKRRVEAAQVFLTEFLSDVQDFPGAPGRPQASAWPDPCRGIW